jgi:SAM-dependent methyltransferase
MQNCEAPPLVLDVCCSARMMWFDKDDDRAIFMDIRQENMQLDQRPGRQPFVVSPNFLADFTKIPFPDDMFSLVVFDPPHFERSGKKGWLAHSYGWLEGDWKTQLQHGFSECFRVLKPEGTLIFKWTATENPASEIVKLAKPYKPLFGHKSGKQAQTHWIAFIKEQRAEL